MSIPYGAQNYWKNVGSGEKNVSEMYGTIHFCGKFLKTMDM